MVLVAVITLTVFWLPWLTKADGFWGVEFGRHGIETIVQNFDGLNYLAVAKTLYDPLLLSRDFAGFGNPPIYYAAHFPLYPLLIKLLDTVVSGPQALLVAIVFSNVLLAVGLYGFFTTFMKDRRLAMWLAMFALFFPARMLSVRVVGSSEPLFMFFALSSLSMAYKGKHWLAAGLGAGAVLTRSPGIFLFGAYILAAIASYPKDWRMATKKLLPYLLMPLALTGLFWLYAQQFGNFWAYFQNSSTLHPVFFPPFLIFSNAQQWITDMWREDILYMYLLYGAGIGVYLKRIGLHGGFERLSAAAYGVLYGLILLMISHRDLARYALPIAPVMFLGLAPVLREKYLKWTLLLLIPIYLLGWQFVVENVQPVSDWSQLL